MVVNVALVGIVTVQKDGQEKTVDWVSNNTLDCLFDWVLRHTDTE
jgi:hypothetical protein